MTSMMELNQLAKIAGTWRSLVSDGLVTGIDAVCGIELAINDRLAELMGESENKVDDAPDAK